MEQLLVKENQQIKQFFINNKMGKILLLLGWDSVFLFGLFVITVILLFSCIPSWLSSLCWSVISAIIVYVATVILPRYRNMRYIKRLLLKRMERLIKSGLYLFENIQAAQFPINDSRRNSSEFGRKIPDSKQIEEICRNIDLRQNPTRMILPAHVSPSWDILILNQCGEEIERNIHEIIISIKTLDNSDLSLLVDDLQNAYDEFKLSFLASVDMAQREPKTWVDKDSMSKLAAKFRDLESVALQYGAKRRP